MTPVLRAVGYSRVSTDDQPTRLADDRARVAAACVAFGYDLVDWIEDDGVSGRTPLADRANGRRVHDLIEAPGRPWADVLIVTNMDRLTRESKDGMALINRMVPSGRRNPVLLVSLDDRIDLTGAMGRFFARFRVLLGEFERELIGERTGNALRHKRRTGAAYARTPYGWDAVVTGTDAHGKETKRLVMNVAEHRVLANMRMWRAEGLADNAIAARLNGLNVPGKRGGRWQANTVWRILRVAGEIAADANPDGGDGVGADPFARTPEARGPCPNDL